jgi:hypothetical protein
VLHCQLASGAVPMADSRANITHCNGKRVPRSVKAGKRMDYVTILVINGHVQLCDPVSAWQMAGGREVKSHRMALTSNIL